MPNEQLETAGLRNAQWTMRGLPANTSCIAVALATQDGASCSGFLYWRGRPKSVVCVMHPREFLVTHYLIPAIVESGCAAWTQSAPGHRPLPPRLGGKTSVSTRIFTRVSP